MPYDRTAYRGANVIERASNAFTHRRGPATRCDKHTIVYRGGLVRAAVLLWLIEPRDRRSHLSRALSMRSIRYGPAAHD